MSSTEGIPQQLCYNCAYHRPPQYVAVRETFIMELSGYLYNWLLSLQVVSSETSSRTGPRKYTISQTTTKALTSGSSFSVILPSLLARNAHSSLIHQLKSLRNNVPENWKTVETAVKALGIILEPHTKLKLLAEDHAAVKALLIKLFKLQKAPRTEYPVNLISSLDPAKDPSTSSSCLEFVLLSFCKHFSLQPTQAAGLLTQNGQYLSQLVSKSSPQLILDWYQAAYLHSQHLASLIANEHSTGSVPFIFSTFKAGFTAKSIEVVIWCCRLSEKLARELADNDLLRTAWDWFVAPGGGLEGCLLA